MNKIIQKVIRKEKNVIETMVEIEFPFYACYDDCNDSGGDWTDCCMIICKDDYYYQSNITLFDEGRQNSEWYDIKFEKYINFEINTFDTWVQGEEAKKEYFRILNKFREMINSIDILNWQKLVNAIDNNFK